MTTRLFAIDDEIAPECFDDIVIHDKIKEYIEEAKIIDINHETGIAFAEVLVVREDQMDERTVTVDIPISKLVLAYEDEFTPPLPWWSQPFLLKGLITLGVLGLAGIGLAIYKHLNG